MDIWVEQRAHTLSELRKWEMVVQGAESQLQKLRDLFGHGDTPLFYALELLQLEYTLAVQEKLNMEWANDEDGWLYWYWLENKMGRGGLEAGYDGELAQITSLEELTNLIIEGLKRDGN
jgi:hypothetical protein